MSTKPDTGMHCPECGNTEAFSITASQCAEVLFSDDGHEVQDVGGDVEWDSASLCRCRKCMHAGTVGDFEAEGITQANARTPDQDVSPSPASGTPARLCDALADCIDGGRLKPSDIPDDFDALAHLLRKAREELTAADLLDSMTPQAFAVWWTDHGSAIRPHANEDQEEHARRVAAAAYLAALGELGDPTTPGHRARVLLEDGRPLVAFPDRPERPGWVQVWSPQGEHTQAQAAYLDGLSAAPADQAGEVLAHYARAYPRTA